MRMEEELLKPKSIKDISVGSTITTVGGKYNNLTAKVAKVGGSYVTFLHPITKEQKRTLWKHCYLHVNVGSETKPPKPPKGFSEQGASKKQVEVLMDLLNEKLKDCSINTHKECVSIMQKNLEEREK